MIKSIFITNTLRKSVRLGLAVCTLFILQGHPAVVWADEPVDESQDTLRERKEKEGYILDLKQLIKKSKKKIEKVNDKLKEQARFRRNQQREEKAREYYNKAMAAFEDDDFDKARELWDKSIQITEHPEMHDYISESVKLFKKKEKALEKAEEQRIKRLEIERGYTAKEVEDRYQAGVKHYKKEDFIEAKIAFEEVDKMFPDHKATRSYLMLINQNIDEEQKQLIEEKLKTTEMARKNEKDQWRRELEDREQDRILKKKEQAEALYDQAIKLYKAHRYTEAKDKFKEVEWIVPDYKKTIKYLSKLDKKISEEGVQFSDSEKVRFFQRELKKEKLGDLAQADDYPIHSISELAMRKEIKIEEEVGFMYDAAVMLYKNREYPDAFKKFKQVQTLMPGFQRTDHYLKKIKKKMPEIEENYNWQLVKEPSMDLPLNIIEDPDIRSAIESRQKNLLRQAETKYDEAVKFYKKDNFVEAKRKFIAVEAIAPNFKDTRRYLSKVDEDISKYQPSMDEYSEVETISADQGETVKKLDRKDKKRKKEKLRKIAGSSTNKALPKDMKEIDVSNVTDYKTLKKKFDQAKKLYKLQKYDQAKDAFWAVDNQIPMNSQSRKHNRLAKDAQKYIEKVEKKLEKDQRYLDERKMADVAKEYRKEEKQKKSDYKKDEKAEKKNQKDLERRHKAMKDGKPIDDSAEQRRSELMAEYGDPSKTLSNEDLILLGGDIQKTKRLSRQKRIIDKAKKENLKEDRARLENERKKNKKVVRRLYDEGKVLFNDKKYFEARMKFAAAERLDPGHKAAKSYLQKIEELGQQHDYETYKDIVGGEMSQLTPGEKKIKKEIMNEYYDNVSKEQSEEFEARKRVEEYRKLRLAEQTKVEKEAVLAQKKSNWKSFFGLGKEVAAEKNITSEPSEYAPPQSEYRGYNENEKEKQELILKRQKDVARQQAQELKQLKKDMEKIYAGAQQLMEEHKFALAKEKFKKYELLLINNDFSDKYKRKNRLRLDEEMKKLNRLMRGQPSVKKSWLSKIFGMKEPDPSRDKASLKEDERLKTSIDVNQQFEQTKKMLTRKESETEQKIEYVKDLDNLRLKIEKEENQLKSDKIKEEQRLMELRRKNEKILRQERQKLADERANKRELEQAPEPAQGGSGPKSRRMLSATRTQQELEDLVKERQEELRLQRDRVRKEFDENIEILYRRAIDLARGGFEEDARIVFEEISLLKPGYKKSEKFLKKLEEKLARESGSSSNEVPQRLDLISQTLDAIEGSL